MVKNWGLPMSIITEIDEYAEIFSRILNCEVKDVEEKFIFNRKGIGKPICLYKDHLQETINELIDMDEFCDTGLKDPYHIELLIAEENRNIGSSFRYYFIDHELVITDNDNGLEYKVSHASDEYILFLISKLANIEQIVEIFGTYYLRHQLDQISKEFSKEIPLFSILRKSAYKCLTLKIESNEDKSLTEFQKFMDSFLFTLSYNFDTAFVQKKSLDEIFRKGKITKIRRSDFSDISAPKRFYSPDLIYHYQLALASDSPPSEYLSYYHIAEHHFESIYKDDLIQRVRLMLTQPDFSYRRKSDIQKIITEINKSIKNREDDVIYNEKEALRLTLIKYVELNELISTISEYDEKLISYYKENGVSFCNGDKIKFYENDPLITYESIANRIYRTRNAIVHSKEGKAERYIPFEHDKILINEIPLIRFIAERIIINTSKQI